MSIRRKAAASMAMGLLAAACSFDRGAGARGGIGEDGGGVGEDGGDPVEPDAEPVEGTPDALGCADLLDFAPSNVEPCDLGEIGDALVLDQEGIYLLDTDSGMLT